MAAITNEVLAEKIDNLNLRFVSMEKKIDSMPGAFISHEVLELKLDPLSNRLAVVENRKTLTTWGIPILCTVAASVITFLIISNLSKG
jgi:hypothetical protein